MPLAGVLDLEGERRRIRREIEKLSKEREAHARKLANADYVGKAPAEVVDKTRAIARSLQEKIERLSRTLQSLG